MFRRAAIAACTAALLAGSGLSLATAEASVSHDRAPAPLLKVGKFRHDFSPNKDGYHDQLKIPVTLTRKALLVVRVVNLDTKVVLAHPGKAISLDGNFRLAKGTHTVQWPDIVHVFDRSSYAGDVRGRYRLTFGAETSAGRYETARSMVVTLRDPVDLDNKADSPELVSPNGDGRQDRLRIRYDVEQASRVRAVVRAVSPRTGESTVVDQPRLGRKKAGHHTWLWSPRSKDGAQLVDGYYTVTLVAVPLQHRRGTGRAGVGVLVDTVAPEATTKQTRTTVYPATTLFTDEVRFEFGKDVAVASLDASVRRADGTLVRTLKPETMPCDYDVDFGFDVVNCALVRWDGRNAAGVAQPAGSYVLRAAAYDAAGNQTVASIPLTVSDQPLVEHTKTTTLPAAQWGAGANACNYPGGPQICTAHGPVASDRYPGGWSFRSASGAAQSIYTVNADTGHEKFRVTATGGPTTPGDPDTASLNETPMQGDGTFATGWIPITMTANRLQAQGLWSVTTRGGNDYDIASYTVEQTYFAPAS